MRQIALDTETTGLEVLEGHRILEIACIEIIDRKITEQKFYAKINPKREVDEEARKVHGYTWDMLKDSPLFGAIHKELLAFVKDSEVLIHNAPFDLGFLDAEFARLELKTFIQESGCNIIDTLAIAKEMHPGQSNTLDALCDRYRIDRSHREQHDALKDGILLAQVYLAMTSGQTSMLFDDETDINTSETKPAMAEEKLSNEGLVVIEASSDELDSHQRFLEEVLDKKVL